MDLEDCINLCSDILNTLDDIEAALEWTFPEEAKHIHAAMSLIEEAQHGMSKKFEEPLEPEKEDHE